LKKYRRDLENKSVARFCHFELEKLEKNLKFQFTRLV